MPSAGAPPAGPAQTTLSVPWNPGRRGVPAPARQEPGLGCPGAGGPGRVRRALPEGEPARRTALRSVVECYTVMGLTTSRSSESRKPWGLRTPRTPRGPSRLRENQAEPQLETVGTLFPSPFPGTQPTAQRALLPDVRRPGRPGRGRRGAWGLGFAWGRGAGG